MSTPIRVDEVIYEDAQKVGGGVACRSIPQQIEFWVKIGKCALDNPDLPIEMIKDLLITQQQDRSLAAPFIFEGKHEKKPRH